MLTAPKRLPFPFSPLPTHLVPLLSLPLSLPFHHSPFLLLPFPFPSLAPSIPFPPTLFPHSFPSGSMLTRITEQIIMSSIVRIFYLLLANFMIIVAGKIKLYFAVITCFNTLFFSSYSFCLHVGEHQRHSLNADMLSVH